MRIGVYAFPIFGFIIILLFSYPVVASPLYGVHMDLTWNENGIHRTRAIQKAREINVQISRNSFLWHKIESVQGKKDWSIPDSIVDELIGAGIEPLFCIYGSPAWANGVGNGTEGYYAYVPTDLNAFNNWLNNYKIFVGEAVRRYKNRVKKWELWNEPNQRYFWKPKSDVDRYVIWYREIYSVIKSIDPSAEVALGGLAGLCCADPIDYSGNAFLKELYKRNVFPDIISIHPYPGKNQAPDSHIQWENNFDDIQLIRDTMIAYGQANREIWITEWGWPTDRISEQKQAEYLQKSLQMILLLYPYATVATYFIDFDRPPKYFHGLYTNDFKLKEAAIKFKEFIENMQKVSKPKNFRVLVN